MDLFYLKSSVLLFENVTLLGNGGNGKLSICHQRRKIVAGCETTELNSSVTCLTEVIGGGWEFNLRIGVLERESFIWNTAHAILDPALLLHRCYFSWTRNLSGFHFQCKLRDLIRLKQDFSTLPDIKSHWEPENRKPFL